MRGDDIAERLLNLAVRVLRLVNALPKTLAGRHIGSQLMRSGTSPGANYEEARGAESRSDFVHKLSIAWKETRETHYWIKVIHKAELIQPRRMSDLLTETNELTAILSQSLKTARKNTRKIKRRSTKKDEYSPPP